MSQRHQTEFSCDRCNEIHLENSPSAKYPLTWGTVVFNGRTRELCSSCMTELKAWFETVSAGEPQQCTMGGMLGTVKNQQTAVQRVADVPHIAEPFFAVRQN